MAPAKWTVMNKLDMSLDKLVDAYLVYQRAAGRSPKTVSWYGQTLRVFFREYLPAKAPEAAALGDLLDRELLRGYSVWLQEEHVRYGGHPNQRPGGRVTSSCRAGYVRSLHAFLHWLYREEYVDQDPARWLPPVKERAKAIEILSEEEIRKLLGRCDLKTVMGARNYCLLGLMLDAGLRLSEAAALKIGDVHEGYVKVLGKGDKERVAPIGAALQRAMLRYQALRPEPRIPTERLFLTDDGLPLGADAVARMVKRVGKAAGIQRLHPHLLRHTGATRMLMAGADSLTVQQILGHTTLEMTRRYTHLAAAHIRAEHRRFSPVDNLLFGAGK